jgi:hypothetical protein
VGIVARLVTAADRKAEEALALELLAMAKRARRRSGRVDVPDHPWERRPQPDPTVDIVAAARAELTKD